MADFGTEIDFDVSRGQPPYTQPDWFRGSRRSPNAKCHTEAATVRSHKLPICGGPASVVKRLLDVTISIAVLLILVPVLLAVAVLVKATSPGPILFCQSRVGRGGKTFQILKFRTMYLGAEALRDSLLSRNIYRDARLFKMPSDPRVTQVGRLLRRTSVDELPQLLNVIRGEMSLVGPRPPLASEVALYETRHMLRLQMRPGITGPWQIAGRSSISEFEHVVALEQEYISNWSLKRDFMILLRTIPAVLSMRGAY